SSDLCPVRAERGCPPRPLCADTFPLCRVASDRRCAFRGELLRAGPLLGGPERAAPFTAERVRRERSRRERPRPAGCGGSLQEPSSLERFVAACTAPMSAPRTPRRSSSSNPAMVVPPGLVTASLSWAGCCWLSRRSLAAP